VVQDKRDLSNILLHERLTLSNGRFFLHAYYVLETNFFIYFFLGIIIMFCQRFFFVKIFLARVLCFGDDFFFSAYYVSATIFSLGILCFGDDFFFRHCRKILRKKNKFVTKI